MHADLPTPGFSCAVAEDVADVGDPGDEGVPGVELGGRGEAVGVVGLVPRTSLRTWLSGSSHTKPISPNGLRGIIVTVQAIGRNSQPTVAIVTIVAIV
jgi:hypothetical protein